MSETLPTCYGVQSNPHEPTEMRLKDDGDHPDRLVECPVCSVIVDIAGVGGDDDD